MELNPIVCDVCHMGALINKSKEVSNILKDQSTNNI